MKSSRRQSEAFPTEPFRGERETPTFATTSIAGTVRSFQETVLTSSSEANGTIRTLEPFPDILSLKHC